MAVTIRPLCVNIPKPVSTVKGKEKRTMLIGNNWKVETDEHYTDNITVYRKSKPRKVESKETWNPEGYFATVAGALHFIVNQEIKGTGLKEFQTVVDQVESIHAMINATLSQTRAL